MLVYETVRSRDFSSRLALSIDGRCDRCIILYYKLYYNVLSCRTHQFSRPGTRGRLVASHTTRIAASVPNLVAAENVCQRCFLQEIETEVFEFDGVWNEFERSMIRTRRPSVH